MILRCQNCDTTLNGTFCHQCGQKHIKGRLTTCTIVSQLIEALTDFDGKLWQTIIKIAANPGQVAISYIEGQRAQFLSPVRFLLIAFSIYFGLMVITGAQIDIVSRLVTPAIDNSVDDSTQLLIKYLAQVIGNQLDVVTFFMIPLFALLVRWQYFRSLRNYAETFTFVCFVLGFGYLIASLLIPIQAALDLNTSRPKNIITGILFIYGARTFFNMSWIMSIISAVVTVGVYFAAFIAVSLGITFAEVYWDQWF